MLKGEKILPVLGSSQEFTEVVACLYSRGPTT
jgi:hypothetical protein